ncbi:phytoene/squalene synthase family protein [Oricola cellulosilytica]|nr:phytoene/squalene synthase family protein [Oricola cellulosilytica]
MGLLREGDRERYLTVLYSPESRRPGLAALFAFNLETSRIREIVSEPMPGEIRLQWWRDAISGDRAAEAMQHPVGAALQRAITRYRLPQSALANLLEARIFDLYNDPMPDQTSLEGYLGETVSVLFQLSAQILMDGGDPGSSDAAGHAGVTFGLTGILRRTVFHRRYQQVFVPEEFLAAAGTDKETWLKGEDAEAAGRVVAMMTALARDHLTRAEMALAKLDPLVKPAFLPLAIVKPTLARIERRPGRVSAGTAGLSPLTAQWRILRRAIGP